MKNHKYIAIIRAHVPDVKIPQTWFTFVDFHTQKGAN